MAKETAFKNGRISNLEGLVTLTLTLDWVTLHTITHRPLPTCQISLKSKKRFVDGHTDGLTFETGFIRSSLLKSQPNKLSKNFDEGHIACHAVIDD